MVIALSSPAKINLFLKITGKRNDGFHELESLFAFLDLADELVIEKSEKFSLQISGEFVALVDQKNNLFTRILDFFSSEFSISKNLKIEVVKNIPVGGGLGGGSSNAAAFMKALNKIFSLNLSKEELQNISLKFGSDIAFFFEDQASIVKGRGEIIENFPRFAPLTALLINPKIHLSTKDVFAKFGSNYSAKISTVQLLESDIFNLINLPNDLEKPAIELAPAIGEIIKNLRDNGADFAKMSGSGSTCFGIFLDEKKLQEAQKTIQKTFPQFLVKKATILAYAE